ncbi:MAG: sulfatase [Marinifilum sp.]|jgi:arylsulfatase|nr:sulfatase [Marinifilum sp.]
MKPLIGKSLLMGALAMCQVTQAVPVQEKEESNKPNVIILFADDLGFGDLGSYGSEIKTPNLDQLAAQGTQFTNFYVAAASCTPSRASLMTGCYPQRVGLESVVDDTDKKGLSSEEFTIADYLKQHGYSTGMFGKWHLGHYPEFMPNQHGFTEFYGIPYSMDMWPFHPKPSHKYPALPVYENEKVVEYNPDVNQMTTVFTERAVDFIHRKKDDPFLLYVPYSQPHVPLGVSDKFKGKSGKGLYADVIMELDWSVGQIMKAVEENGLSKNTIIMFSSDNGPWLSYGNHAGSSGGLREGKGTVFGGGHKVPFIASMPGTIPSGKINDEMITAMDILPTALKLVNASFPRMNPIDGKDIWPILSGVKGAKTPHKAFFFVNKKEIQAVRSGKWKLHVPHAYRICPNVGKDGMPGNQDNFGGKIELSLYNIEKDPAESNNLVKKHPKIVKQLLEYIKEFEIDLKENSRPVGMVNK